MVLRMKRLLSMMAIGVLTACTSGEVRDNLGLHRSKPDEFKVVSRPPLSVPPEFSLTPPEEGAGEFQLQSMEEKAASLLLQETSAVDEAVAKGSSESIFLNNIGADKADPDVRRKISKEFGQPVGKKESTFAIDAILNSEDPTVDAPKEAERIRDNLENDRPINEGEVPVIESTPVDALEKWLE